MMARYLQAGRNMSFRDSYFVREHEHQYCAVLLPIAIAVLDRCPCKGKARGVGLLAPLLSLVASAGRRRGRARAPPRRVAVSCPRSSTAVRGGSSLLYLPVRAYQWPHVHAPPSVGRGPTRATSDTQLPFRYITCRLAWLSSAATSFYALLHLETRHSVFFSFLRR